MSPLLTQQQKFDFEQDGIVKLPNAIEENLLTRLNQCFEWSIANPGPIAVGNPSGDNINFLDNANPKAYKMYSDLVLESNFGAIAAELWDSEYVGFLPSRFF